MHYRLNFILRSVFALSVLLCSHAAFAISSGQTVTGVIAAPEGQRTHSFYVAEGESFTLQIAELSGSGSGFDAAFEVKKPGGGYLQKSAHGYSSFTWTAETTGTYSVVVFDYSYDDATGSYNLSFVKGNGSTDQGTMTSGGTYSGTIEKGGLDSYTFSAAAGESFTLQIAELSGSGFDASIEVMGPDGGYLSKSTHGYSSYTWTAETTGTYSVVVFDYSYDDATGSYNLSFVKGNGSTDQGTMTSGGTYSGTIEKGGLDSYTFSAAAGESFTLQIAELSGSGFDASIEVMGPDGGYLSKSTHGYSSYTWTAETTGTYSVVVFDYSYDDATGSYNLSFVKGNGSTDQGTMTSGGTYSGTIEKGGLDSYTFSAAAGESFTLQIAELSGSGFDASIEVMGPDGGYLSKSTHGYSSYTWTAETTGTYSVVVFDYSYDDATGSYNLSFVKGNGSTDQGTMTSGGTYSGTIEKGGLDSYTFSAAAGESFTLQIAELSGSGFDASIEVMGPDGGYLSKSTHGHSSYTWTAETAGTYSVVVFDYSYDDATGSYTLDFNLTTVTTSIPAGAITGNLTNGGRIDGSYDFAGDVDKFRLPVVAGDQVILQLGEFNTNSGGVNPWIQVFGGAGKLLAEASNSALATVSFRAEVSQTLRVVVRNSGSYTGNYQLYTVVAGQAYSVPAGDEGGAIENGARIQGSLARGDLDLFSVNVSAGNRLRVKLAELGNSGSVTPTLRIFDSSGTLLGSNSAAVSSEISLLIEHSDTLLIAASNASSAASSNYELTTSIAGQPYSVPLGDAGGPLANGELLFADLIRADLDAFHFPVNRGDAVVVRLAEAGSANSGGFSPRLELFSEDGRLLAQSVGSTLVELRYIAESNETVAVWASNTGTATGNYELQATIASQAYATAPTDQGGSLTAGVISVGDLARSDMDMYTIAVTGGTDVRLLMEEQGNSGGFTPRLRVYNPDGDLVAFANAATLVDLEFRAPATEQLLVVASNDGSGVGNYHILAFNIGSDADSDLDGLLDSEEASAGTDSHNPDTDGDTMPDAYELANGLNPLVNDAGGDLDGDGISNLEEYQNATDPDGELGDANGDGHVDIADILLVQRHINALETLDAAAQQRCDLYPVGLPDGVIDISDLLLLTRAVMD